MALEETRTLGGSIIWQPSVRNPVLQNNQWVLTLNPDEPSKFFRLHGSGLLTRIAESSPADGETGVAVTRETILRFTQPLSPDAMVGPANFYAEFGGRKLLSRVELSSDRKTATLFYPAENLPGSARVRVTLRGDGLLDRSGVALDADGDGVPGGTAVIEFDTLSITPVPQTAVIGRVFASELQPGPGTGLNALNRPLEGVIITVDGMEQTLRARTDAMGNFKLEPAPAGRFFVHVDGRTAVGSQWPDGAYYPVVGKAWEAAAGKADNLAGGTGEIFLPRITPGTLKPVSSTADTKVEFPAEVLLKNPDLAGVSITVPAGSLFNDAGLHAAGKVGIAPVPPDRLPEKLPLGLDFPLVITVQTDGPSNFDRPVPVRFPNLPDPKTGKKLPPGAKSALWSFNHDTGRWEIQGSMTVSADGNFVETDPGVGIRQPGWHGTQPGSQGDGGGYGGAGGGPGSGAGGGGGSGSGPGGGAGGGGEGGAPDDSVPPDLSTDGSGDGTDEGQSPDDNNPEPDPSDDGDDDECGIDSQVALKPITSEAVAWDAQAKAERYRVLGRQLIRLITPENITVIVSGRDRYESSAEGGSRTTIFSFPLNIAVSLAEKTVRLVRSPSDDAPGCTEEIIFEVVPNSGSHWVSSFRQSTDLADLEDAFEASARAFLDALRAGGASVSLSTTFRPHKRAYLMHYCGVLAASRARVLAAPPPYDPELPAVKATCNGGDDCAGELLINWLHLDQDGQVDRTATVGAARAMSSAYGIAFPAAFPPGRHGFNPALAVDVTIDWLTPSATFKWPEGVAKPTAAAAEAAFETATNQPWPADVPLPDGTPGGFIQVPNASCMRTTTDSSGNIVGARFDNSCNPILHMLGVAYGLKKLIPDPPHWSDNGH